MNWILKIFAIFILASCTSPAEEKIIVEKGQVWRYESEDPFEKNQIRDYLVLDVSGDYVKYVNIEFIEDKHTYYNSDKISWFINMRERIK